MEDYIFDGEPHALNKELAYILKKIHPERKDFDLKEECMSIYRKYAEYLYANDKDEVIEYLMKVFNHHLTFEEDVPGTSMVMRPPHMVSVLAQYGSLALKFKRVSEDTLVTQ